MAGGLIAGIEMSPDRLPASGFTTFCEKDTFVRFPSVTRRYLYKMYLLELFTNEFSKKKREKLGLQKVKYSLNTGFLGVSNIEDYVYVVLVEGY